MKLNIEHIKLENRYWGEINILAKEAFPPEEYLAPEELVKMSEADNFDFLALLEDDSFVGFMVVQTCGSLAYLFFLAIDSAHRSKGYGSKAIETLKELYPDKKQVVDFEMLDESAGNNKQRVKRKEFYLRNGYKETGLFLSYLGVDYEVMCMEEDFSEDEFRELMKSIQVEGFHPRYYHKLQLYIFHTGRVRVDRAIPLHERNPLAVTGFFRGKDKQMILPVSAYLIRHPKGNVLIDTGWDTKYAFERPKQLFGMVDKISAPIIQEGEGIDSKLEKIGLTTSDLTQVFISHMDFDHASGLRLIKDAKDIRTSEEEWKACNHFSLRYVDTWTDICKIQTFSYRNSGIGPVGRSYDVFGDGSVLLVHTPGHSQGLFSVLICGKEGYIVLGNDAGYLPESFSEHRIPGFTVNRKLAEKSLDWLIKCKNDPSCLGVFVNHDPNIEEQCLEMVAEITRGNVCTNKTPNR